MKKWLLLTVLLLVVTGVAQAIPDPSAWYCTLQGYELEIRTDEQGGQYGVCVFPDDSECSAWHYYCKCEPDGISCWPGDFSCHWPCEEMRCKEAGEAVLVSTCCEGLGEIYPPHIFDANCNKLQLVGWLFLCSECGNGICEDWESRCNCPEDCAQPSIIYVDADANGLNNGSSWADAYKYLQDALVDANSGDEIHVAEGIYTPDRNSADPSGSGDRTATFQLINGVTLKGGYAGFGEPDPNTRDIELYETILSGDLDGNDIDIIDINDPWDLLTEPTRSENSYHVLTGSGTDETAVLDGFNIAGGNANYYSGYPPHAYSCGGGMYTDSGGSTVLNCTFRINSADKYGGGMYNSSSVLRLVNCAFQENAAKRGGGIHNQTSDLTFTNCTFRGNTASFGAGGMGIEDSNAILTDCAFSGNKAGYIVGGLHSINSNVTLTNCILTGNASLPTEMGMGGGIGGGLGISDGNAIVTECIFNGNSAGAGGGMFGYGRLTLNNCIFSGNSAVSVGGGMDNWSRNVPAKITNCIFSGNSAGYEGGGIRNCEYGGSSILTNCTFSGNSAVYGVGGGICNEYRSSTTLINCILWGNTALSGPQVEMRKKESVTKIYYSCIEGGQVGIYDPYDGLVWGAGNIDLDPCFAEPGYWDPNGTPADVNDDFWVDGDYHLRSQAGRWTSASSVEPDANDGRWTKDEVTSPCIDAGDPKSPIGYELFPNGGIINMGAYGGTVKASKSYFGEPVCETVVAGDINGDCKVNFLDFRIMAFHWLRDENQ